MLDLEVLEDLKKVFGTEKDLDTLVFALCRGYVSDYIDDVFEDFTYDELIEKFNEILDSFGYEHIEQDGGGEGGSEYCYGVFKLKDKLYKAEYNYYSYDGYHYDDIHSTLKEVHPIVRPVTFYE